MMILATLLLLAAASPASEIDEFVSRADELIEDRNYHAEVTAHYRVKSDDPRIEVGAVARLLESFRDYFDEFWSGRTALIDYDRPSRVYLFYSRYKYKQLHVSPGTPLEDATVGHYRSFFDVVALHTDTVGLQDLPDVLVHEAAHQLVQMRIYGSGRVPSAWVSEGLASYFGNTLRDKDGAFRPGRIGGKGATFFKNVPPATRGAGWSQWKDLRRSIKSGEALPVRDLIATLDPAVFYDDRAAERYSASWMLVHFLLHGGNGAHAAGFVAYLAREARGQGGADALYEEIGLTPEQLETAYRQHVLKLKIR